MTCSRTVKKKHKRRESKWFYCPQGLEVVLTSLLVRPPLPHLCSLRVCNKQGVSSSQQLLIIDSLSVSQTFMMAHQVFELCRQAAIVRFFHVHDFCVGAEDIKLARSKTVKGGFFSESRTVIDDKSIVFPKSYPRIEATSPDSLKNRDKINKAPRSSFPSLTYSILTCQCKL